MSPRSHLTIIGAGLLSLAAGAAVLPFAASARQPAPPPAAPFGGPGRMAPPASRVDLKAQLEKRFDALDTNHDGTVTPAEREAPILAFRKDMRDRMFARLDADKNGAISKAEFAAAPPPGARGSGGPGPEGGPPPMGAGPGGPDGPHHRGMGRRGHHGGKMMGGGMMGGEFAMSASTTISRAQFVTAGLTRFDRVDTDHDGRISDAERDAARKAMRDRFAPANRPPPPPPGL